MFLIKRAFQKMDASICANKTTLTHPSQEKHTTGHGSTQRALEVKIDGEMLNPNIS
jgi:hypothetical protein